MWTVLYVEDEENDVLFMRRSFRRAGLEDALRVVVDGVVAIDYLSGRAAFRNRLSYPLPAVVLLDLNLPTVSGFQVLQWIRRQPQFQQLPVVIFSSSSRPEDRLQAKELGASDYLEKPDSGLDFGVTVEALKRKWLAQPLAQGGYASNPGSVAAPGLGAQPSGH
jgi:CheY-like chemotaxis protein